MVGSINSCTSYEKQSLASKNQMFTSHNHFGVHMTLIIANSVLPCNLIINHQRGLGKSYSYNECMGIVEDKGTDLEGDWP